MWWQYEQNQKKKFIPNLIINVKKEEWIIIHNKIKNFKRTNSKKFVIREYKAKTRDVSKRNTLINKTAGFFKGKNSNNSTNNKLGSRSSIIKKNEDNGKFRNKDI